MITKNDLVVQALDLAGLSSSANPASPEMVKKGLVSLELLMTSLEGKTYVEYLADDSTFNPSGACDSGVKPNEASDVVKYIAVNICESLAVPFTDTLKQMSRRAYRKLLDNTPKESVQGENIPAGQGNLQGGGWGWCSPYLKGDDDEDTTTTKSS